MSLFIISILILGIAIFFMSFNIIFRKDGKFPESEVGHNKEMKRRGLVCAKSEERALWNRSDGGGGCSSCCCSSDD